jgi:uncharacterized protein YegL
MPKLDSQNLNTASGFSFSGERIENLQGSTQYSLISIAVDVSSSTYGFNKDCVDALLNIVEGCRKAPEKDKLLLRIVKFGSNVEEVIGFTLVDKIQDSDISGKFHCGGSTCLYDACGDSLDSILSYADQLAQQYYRANGLVVVLTDGEENTSKIVTDPSKLRDIISSARKSERLDSIKSVLVGLTSDNNIDGYLKRFKDIVEFDQYEKMSDVSPKGWAKAQGFISQYISTTSQSLGSGKPSATLTF